MKLLEVYDVYNEDGTLKCERLLFKQDRYEIQIGAYPVPRPDHQELTFDKRDDFSFYYVKPCELASLKGLLNRIYLFGRRAGKPKGKPRGSAVKLERLAKLLDEAANKVEDFDQNIN